MTNKSTTHYLERINPTGRPFIGRCILCGATDLSFRAALEPCPNPKGLSQDEALVAAIEGNSAPGETKQ